jgi:hypothetical protein
VVFCLSGGAFGIGLISLFMEDHSASRFFFFCRILFVLWGCFFLVGTDFLSECVFHVFLFLFLFLFASD